MHTIRASRPIQLVLATWLALVPLVSLVSAVASAEGNAKDDQQITFTEGSDTLSLVPAWRQQTEDEILLMALILVNSYNTGWREQIAPVLVPLAPKIVWGDLRDDVGGVYSPRSNRITINRSLKGEPFGVIAAVLTHESYHAVSLLQQKVDESTAEEVRAFTWEAKTWDALPARWRANTDRSHLNDALVKIWKASNLEKMVTSSDAYQQECRIAPAQPTKS